MIRFGEFRQRPKHRHARQRHHQAQLAALQVPHVHPIIFRGRHVAPRIQDAFETVTGLRPSQAAEAQRERPRAVGVQVVDGKGRQAAAPGGHIDPHRGPPVAVAHIVDHLALGRGRQPAGQRAELPAPGRRRAQRQEDSPGGGVDAADRDRLARHRLPSRKRRAVNEQIAAARIPRTPIEAAGEVVRGTGGRLRDRPAVRPGAPARRRQRRRASQDEPPPTHCSHGRCLSAYSNAGRAGVTSAGKLYLAPASLV